MQANLSVEIASIFKLNSENPRQLLKMLSRSAITLRRVYGSELVDSEIASYYLFFEDHEYIPLRKYLFTRYEALNNGLTSKRLESLFQKAGVLVFKLNDNHVKVIHPNNKQNNISHPVQLSNWLVGIGVSGDSCYKTLLEAIEDNALGHYKPLEDEGELNDLSEQLVLAESMFQENYKAKTGEYRL